MSASCRPEGRRRVHGGPPVSPWWNGAGGRSRVNSARPRWGPGEGRRSVQLTVKLTGPDSLGEWAESPLYFALAVCSPAASLIFTVTWFEATCSGSEEDPSTVKTTVPVSGGAPTVRWAGETRADMVTGRVAVGAFGNASLVPVAIGPDGDDFLLPEFLPAPALPAHPSVDEFEGEPSPESDDMPVPGSALARCAPVFGEPAG